MPKLWRVYSRVSSDEQARFGGSLEAQAASCRALAIAKALPLGPNVEDAGISGSSLDRPGIEGLLQEAEAGTLGGIIVWKLDRLTRSLRDLIALMERFHELGVGVMSVQENLDTNSPMGRFALHLLGALAQLEREQVSERIRFVQAHKRSQGAFLGGAIATGLKTVQDGRNRKLVVDETYSEAMSKIWNMVIGGATLRDIARHLDDSKVPARGGKRWSKNSAGQVIRNDTYIGLLVDAETFNRAGAVMGCRFSPSTAKLGVMPIGMTHQAPTDRVWRLQGLAFCAQCGMALSGSQSRSKTGAWYPYLRCSGKQKRLGGCSAPDLPATQVEDMVVAALVKGINQAQLTDVLAREQATRQHTVAPLRKERAAIQIQQDDMKRRIDTLLDLVTEGSMAAKAVGPRLSGLQRDLDQLANSAAEIDGRLAAATISAGDLAAVEETLHRGLEMVVEQPWSDQKAIVAGLVKRMKIAAGMPLEIEVALPLAQVRTDVREWCAI